MRYTLPILLLTSLTTTPFAYAADAPTIKHPFKAELVTTRSNDGTVLSKSKVLMTRKGVRIDTPARAGVSPHIVYIQNFSTSESWMLTLQGKRATKIVEDTQGGDMDDMEGGVMSTEPCMGSRKQAQPAREWNGEKVQAWSCSRNGVVHAYQLFSPKFGIVVREERPDGERDELVNLATADADEGVFTPPKDYRTVSLPEFFTGTQQLQKFDGPQ